MEHEYRPAICILVCSLAVVSVIAILVLWAPGWMVDRSVDRFNPQVSAGEGLTLSERLSAENDVRSTLMGGLAGIFFIVTAYFTWRQIQLTQDKQFAEQFSKAVDQLTDQDRVDVRLRGIYSLESLARSSRKDRAQIDTVLSEFALRCSREIGEQAKESKAKGPRLKRRSPELHAILEVIGRRHVYTKAPGRLELDGLYAIDAHLDQTRLMNAFLRNAQFKHSHLNGARFEKCSLRNAWFTGCELEDADFSGSDLRDAHFEGAKLEGVRMAGAWYNDETKWPDGFNNPAGHGAIHTNEVGRIDEFFR